MALKLLAGPEDDAVTLAVAKAHLNVIGSDDDDLIRRLIASATASLDGPFGDIGRCLVAQLWELTLDAFPQGPIVIPMPPTMSVPMLAYWESSTSLVASPLDPGASPPPSGKFIVSGLGSERTRISPASGVWPSTAAQPDAVIVSFIAGFAEFGDDLPADLRNLILARVAAAYAVRESTVIGIQQGANAETDAVVDRYRTRGF